MQTKPERTQQTKFGTRTLALVLAVSQSLVSSASAAPRAAAMPEPSASAAPTASQAESVSFADTARALELGTRRMASHLLTRSPSRAARHAAPGKGATRLLWPVATGHFVRGFGFVRKERKDLPHLGVDIAAPTGTPIMAAADGIVGYANHGVKGYGNLAILVHADGSVSSYAHCDKLRVEPGQTVRRGEVIADVGSTGISKGPHVHFEFRTHGRPRNPMARFDRPAREPKELPALAMLNLGQP